MSLKVDSLTSISRYDAVGMAHDRLAVNSDRCVFPWKVFNPDGTILYEQDRMIEDSFSFVALQTGSSVFQAALTPAYPLTATLCCIPSRFEHSGLHKVCFGNTMSTLTAKSVSFSLYVGTSLTSHGVARSGKFVVTRMPT